MSAPRIASTRSLPFPVPRQCPGPGADAAGDLSHQENSPDERPALAAGVRLLGEMEGIGFVERQFLIERDTQFVQLSELLYRVAEAMNGNRTTHDIAAIVTETTPWALEPHHVHHLIESKLRPLGIAAARSGQTSHTEVLSRHVDHTPLRLAMRMKMLSPRVIAPLTRVLQYLFAPTLLVPMCLLIGVSHWWLYGVHGIDRSIERLLNEPGGLLIVLALAVVAGAFHELGHASALRYGGGRPRGIGFGLYLVYPAFYSDVTDSYRLGRRARIRTDLGGVYFHLVFAVALMAVAVATGSEFLLVTVVLFDIEALRQFIPFVRLDGYWLLADMTGIPDPFSVAGPFLRRVFRRPGSQAALKPWVARTFAIYLAVTIPVLAYVFASLIVYLPELVRLTYHALAAHMMAAAEATAAGNRFLILMNVLLVPLPLIVTLYFLFRLVIVPLVRSLGRQMSPAAGRLTGASALAACMAIVTTVWTPAEWSRQSSARREVPVHSGGSAGDDGVRVLADAQRLLRNADTMRAEMHGAVGSDTFTGTLMLRRPNRARVRVAGSGGIGEFEVVSDGRGLYVYFPASMQYTRATPARDGRNISGFIVDHVRTFFAPERLMPRGADERATYVGRERIGGIEYDVVEVSTTARAIQTTWRYYLSSARLVQHIAMEERRDGGQASRRWVQLEDVQLDILLQDDAFQWSPPPGARLMGLADLGIELPSKTPPR